MTDLVATARLEDERVRGLIRELRDRTLLVQAGAGTGKTSSLVDRILALLRSGHTTVDRMIAITFTEKAAAELKDRVRSALERAAPADEAEASRVAAALQALDMAAISTIHAFGQSLLKAFAPEAGIDPSFEVQDEMVAERRLQDRWRAYLDTLGTDAAATEAVDRALGLGMLPRNLETLMREMVWRPGLAEQLDQRPLLSPAVALPDLGVLTAELEGLGVNPVPAHDQLRQRIAELAGLVQRLRRAGEDDRETALATGLSVLGYKWGRAGSQANWGGAAAIAQARQTAEAVQSELRATLEAWRAAALAGVLPLIVKFVLNDRRERGRAGTLTFDDLILEPARLLRHPAAARALQSRFDVLLIDEFQDTDPLQTEIALAFATDPDTGNLEAGRLFLVGDPKQSIYRFRRADMAIYSRTFDRLKSQGAVPLSLVFNRRSRRSVVEWVNRVCGTIIGDGHDQTVQPAYEPIQWERDMALKGPGVAVSGGVVDGPARQARVIEAGNIARLCSEALEWDVAERDGTVRPAMFRDIAILLPTRSSLISIERALSAAGVPYRVEGGSLVYATQEVRDLINCLTAIADPSDEVAVVAALRSPAFACSDVDLARFRAGGGRFNYLRGGNTSPEGPVREALATLAQFHEGRHDGSLASLVERFIADRGLVEVGVLAYGSRDSFRRMRFVYEQARAFEASGPEDLRTFVSWLEQRAGGAFLDHEGTGLDDDEDAVRILTIHGAKGLEFPIVIVAGLAAAQNVRPPVYLVDRSSERVAVRSGSLSSETLFCLGPTEELGALERRHAEAEFARLLYVATTRARDHLVISLFHARRAPEKCGARLILDAGGAEGVERFAEGSAQAGDVAMSFSGLDVAVPDITEEAFEDGRRTLVQRASVQHYTSATALGAMRKEETTDETEPWARGRGGTHRGRAVHAAIQSLRLDATRDEVQAYARAQAVAEAIPDRADEVAELVWAALNSAAALRARTSRRALREVPFAWQQDGTVVEGFIDMVIENDDGLEIVDWKTDMVPVEAIPKRLQEYELQAGLYVLGLEEATGKPVARVTYVFVGAGEEASPGEPADLARAARERPSNTSVGGQGKA